MLLSKILLLLFLSSSIYAFPAGRQESSGAWNAIAQDIQDVQTSQWQRSSKTDKDEWFEWMNGYSELPNEDKKEPSRPRRYQVHRAVSDLFRSASAEHENPIEHTPVGRQRQERSRDRVTLHTCSECGGTFNRRKLLERHWKVHTGERPYQCAFCDVRMSRSDNMLEHMKTQHGFIPSR